MADTASDNEMEHKLKQAGLRLTKPRIALGSRLFGGKNRHVTAESFHEEAVSAGIRVSLATIYNTLHQFTGAGLLREVVVDGAKIYFDTNTSDHHHFYMEEEDVLVDIPAEDLGLSNLPGAPKGKEISRVDVIVRLKNNTCGPA
jgi:Fur family iron response transcriptional regulator